MTKALPEPCLDTLFREARSHNAWTDQPVTEDQLRVLYDLLNWGPTSANCCPARFVFVTSQAGKEKLKPHLMGSNQDKTMAAPVTVIIANDMEFYEKVPQLFPHAPEAKDWFTGSPEATQDAAMRNGTLQGAYLMLAARSLGLDCGPMSGFDQAGVDGAFFAGTSWRSNFLCNLGIGDPNGLFPRSPRLAFDDACRFA
ncbi:MAG: malonic semialdehyde reductase [Pseudomonadota bacterium]